jgi:poly(3-hydroxybutyrate) depolymerase
VEELGMINRLIDNTRIHFGMMLKLICLSVTFQVILASALLNDDAWAGSWQSIQAGGMSVELYVPATAPKLENKRALMISLHGCVQTNTVLRDHGNWKGLSPFAAPHTQQSG